MSEIDRLSLLMSLGRYHLPFHDRESKSMAKKLLSHFGTLENLLGAGSKEWGCFIGMSRSRLELLDIVASLFPRKQSSPQLSRSSQAVHWFEDIANQKQEVVVGAFLNTDNCLIAKEEIFRGTVSSSMAQPREILIAALKSNAAKIIVAHNHPSERVQPSEQDLLFTVRMEWASETIGIPLIDHIIVGGRGEYFSFAEAKLMGKGSKITKQQLPEVFESWNRPGYLR